MTNIIIGTCSWTDPTLLSTDFYPKEANSPEKRLRYYASHFSLVEVDSIYYSLPAQNTVRLWIQRTPEDFIFDAKAFSLFTWHPTKMQAIPKDLRGLIPKANRPTIYYQDVPENAREILWQRFKDGLLPLDNAGKLGIVLFQFPNWFLPSEASNHHILECKNHLPQYRLAIEFRNEAWLNENKRRETLDFLEKNELSYVCVDEPQGSRASVPPIAEATTNISIVRFHGRNQNNWNKKGISVVERFRYLYNDDDLLEWLPKLAKLSSKVKQLHILFNNCYADYGIKNAYDIDRLIKSQSSLFPDYLHVAQQKVTQPTLEPRLLDNI